MQVLGIESSCDETAVAIVDGNRNILGHKIMSQVLQHQDFGGVVPEIAARSHIDALPTLVRSILNETSIKLSELDAIAVTSGPGLIGGLIVGIMVAKGIAVASNKPIIAVNHLEGHALSPRLDPGVDFPYLLLLISGGHCQLLLVKGVGNYTQLGSTMDDALGEAFDKVAKMLGLGYPGGPQVEKWAARSKGGRTFSLPKPLLAKSNLNFSFSGLKTAVSRLIAQEATITEDFKADMCASFQKVASEILLRKLDNALKYLQAKGEIIENVVIAGGVAANSCIRRDLQTFCSVNQLRLTLPPLNLCTDNAAMIAWAGIERIRKGEYTDISFPPKSRWPLEEINI